MSEDLPRRRHRTAVAAAAVVGLGVGVAAAALVIGANDGGDPPPSTIDPAGITLVSFDTCDNALQELKQTALANVGPYGLGGGGEFAVADSEGSGNRSGNRSGSDEAEDAAPAGAAPRDGNGAPGAAAEPGSTGEKADSPEVPDHSTTNVHESGVDEPDLVKTDGSRLVSITDGRLRVLDVASRTQTGMLELPGGYATQLLLDGDRALVLTGEGDVIAQPGRVPGVAPGESPPDGKPAPYGSQVVLVDLAGEPRVLGTLSVEGSYLDARQVGSVARVVVRSQPRLGFVYPNGVRSPTRAELDNRSVIERSSLSDWLPRYELEAGGRTSSGQLTDCASVSHPRSYTGSSMLSVLTFDLQGELGAGDPVTIVADGDTVYGTGTSLYVADDHVAHVDGFGPADNPTTDTPVSEQRTEVYQFDISEPGKPVHVASGGVPGVLLNQYSLSEHEGHLRIATTVQGGQSESMVSVLRRQGDVLTQVGQVGGLGLGERIYAVRFLGDTGYVVTFRETDPLYTVDLSDPASPAVTGELKITGYSAYLHPAGDGRLIGVGQEATGQGQRTGTQLSLFDTADPAGASRVAQYHLADSFSEVEADPHAFLYWPDEGLVVLPVTGEETAARGTPTGGALVLKLSGDSFTEVGMIGHTTASDEPAIAPRRALVIGTELWTVSEAGVKVNALDGLAELAWVPF